MSDRIVTELIVDARGAKQGTDEYVAAMRVAQTAVDRLAAAEQRRRQQEGSGAGAGNERLKETAQAYSAAERAANNYLVRLDPLFAANQKLGREVNSVQAAMRGLDQQLMRGSVTAAEYNQRQAQLAGRLGEVKAAAAGLASGAITTETALKSLSTQMERTSGVHIRLAGTANQTSFALRNMGLQSIDVAQQVASGAPLMMTFVQQGGQIAQIAAQSSISLGQMARALGGLVMSFAPFLAIAAVTAGVVALGAAAESTARQTLALQGVLRATRTDYQALAVDVRAAAKELAATTGISTSDALTSGKAIAASAYFAGTRDDLRELIKTAADLDVVFDKAGAGAERLAKAMADPGKIAKELADSHFPGMSQSLALVIQRMQDGGDRAGAFNRVLEAMRVNADGAREQSLTPLQQEIEKLGAAFTSAGQSGRSLADSLGGALSEVARGAIAAVTTIIAEVNRLREFAASIPGAEYLSGAPGGVGLLTGGWAANIARQLLGKPGATAGRTPQQELAELEQAYAAIPEAARSMGVGAGAKLRMEQLSQQISGVVRAVQDQSMSDFDMRGLTGSTLRPIQAMRADFNNAVGSARGIVAASPAGTIKGLEAERDKLVAMRKEVVAGTADYRLFSDAIAVTEKKIADTAKSMEGATKKGEAHRTGIEKATDKIAVQTAAQEQLAEAWRAGGVGVDEITARLKAQEQAISGGLTPGTAKHTLEVLRLTDANLKLNQATGQAKYEEQITGINRATEAQLGINEAFDGSEQSLTHATNAAKAYATAIDQGLKPGTDEFTNSVERMTDALDRSSEATRALQHAQDSMRALGGILDTTFDRLGQSLVDAFVSGRGAAVNFGNVLRGVISSVISEVAKLAIINPLLNSILPTSGGLRPTLGAAFSVLGAGGGGGGTSGGGMGVGISDLMTVGSIGDALGLTNFGGQLSGLGNTLGLTGEGGLFSGLGLDGIGSGITSLLGTPILGSGALTGATTSALSSLGTGVYGPATASAVGIPGVTLGAALSGVGLGFGAGSMAGGFVQSAMNKTGYGPQIGAGTGALAGAAIGSIVPGIGTVIGGLIGGLIGGGGGGMIGPNVKNPYSYSMLGFSPEGYLTPGVSQSQILDSNGAETLQQTQAFNNALKGLGITIESFTSRLGRYIPGQAGAGFQVGFGSEENTALVGANLNEVFSKFAFQAAGSTAEDKVLSGILSGRNFGSPEELANAVAQFRSWQAQIAEFLNTMAPALTKFDQSVGSLNQQITGITAQFDPAIAAAQQLRASGAATADQLTNLVKSENDLTAARERAIRTATAAADKQYADTTNNLNARYAAANAQMSGVPSDALAVSLSSFDMQSSQQRLELGDAMEAIWGEGIRSTAEYATQMARLERALGAERLAIQKAANDNIAQAERQINDTGNDIAARYLAANAQISGLPADALAASLYAFDIQSDRQRREFGDAMAAIWGESVRSTTDYATRTAALERTLGAERLAIQKAANDNIAQAEQAAAQAMAQTTVSSLSNYIRGLQTSDASPLSAMAQYDLARTQFDTVASGGYATASQLPSVSDALLSASRTVNGSGAGYANDFQRVLQTLERTIPAVSDQLNSLTFNSGIQVLSADLSDVKVLLRNLLSAFETNSKAPARLAA